MMKAWVIDGQFGLDHLKLVERPKPEPRFGEVVVRTRAVSLNYRDTQMVGGTYPFKFPLPLVPTSDGVGEVVAVGEGVSRVKSGDRVLGTFWQSWLGGDFDLTEEIRQLGGDQDGMLSEYVRLDQHGLVHAPEHLSDEEASTLPCAALTAWQALVTEGHLKAGETVLVQARGRVDIRPPVRSDVRRDDDRHFEQRRQTRPRKESWRDPHDQPGEDPHVAP